MVRKIRLVISVIRSVAFTYRLDERFVGIRLHDKSVNGMDVNPGFNDILDLKFFCGALISGQLLFDEMTF